jgi:hypothetical protein
MNYSDLKPNYIVRGSIFPEPVQVILVTDVGGNHPLAGLVSYLVNGGWHDDC